ncbi:hypothetical protein D8895_06800 [Streptococcus sp. BCA20]|jgi:hypothetical protein|uniref:Uncharacterized protein n=1 Tax=Streptococcus oralis TaxID=1303 RepID=A0A081R2A2_STROR|nr:MULTISPECIES: hypothetical protein [Streptococcus]RSJ36704.1 hypothetical protein D8895_06800 [Streptococcus sp. BCA20]KEQ49325.1 hypothetical protein SK143_2001 [Streptococcus oralis]MCY7068684.1 hypothetical protein [Streptococcus oralis]MDO6346690.1 hypothetical protein [Streptococcus sp. GP0011]OFO20343.1 hypothetical protein HMPREF3057_01525 [Streptococcus sp. HMSC072D05]
MKKRTLLCLVLALVVFGGGAWLAQETNLFLSPRAKQLAYLKEHEEEIVKFVKSKNSKIESVQIAWDETKWEKVGNGTPQGGGEIVNVYGGFNHIESSSWNVTFDIENDKIIPNSMALANYLRMGGRIFD